jgi:hypothetical protein
MRAFFLPLTRSQSVSLFLALSDYLIEKLARAAVAEDHGRAASGKARNSESVQGTELVPVKVAKIG